MRKYILIIITIIAALLVSCNIDATDGIYSEAAASTESTSVTTRNFLGQNSSGQYFYLTDEGVFKIGTENALFCKQINLQFRLLILFHLLISPRFLPTLPS